jgi:hypothetical protein
MAVERGSDDEVTVYVSWNGATEVDTWQVIAGPDPDELEPVGSAPWRGFETTIVVNTTEPYIAVQARSASGRTLGTSKVTKLG